MWKKILEKNSWDVLYFNLMHGVSQNMNTSYASARVQFLYFENSLSFIKQ